MGVVHPEADETLKMVLAAEFDRKLHRVGALIQQIPEHVPAFAPVALVGEIGRTDLAVVEAVAEAAAGHAVRERGGLGAETVVEAVFSEALPRGRNRRLGHQPEVGRVAAVGVVKDLTGTVQRFFAFGLPRGVVGGGEMRCGEAQDDQCGQSLFHMQLLCDNLEIHPGRSPAPREISSDVRQAAGRTPFRAHRPSYASRSA